MIEYAPLPPLSPLQSNTKLSPYCWQEWRHRDISLNTCGTFSHPGSALLSPHSATGGGGESRWGEGGRITEPGDKHNNTSFHLIFSLFSRLHSTHPLPGGVEPKPLFEQ